MGEYIELISQLKQKNGAKFPIADVNDLKGGYIQVNNITDMEAFTDTGRTKEGMLCYVKTTSDSVHMYQFYGDTWVPWSGGGGSGGNGASIKAVTNLTELNNPNLKIIGQIVFIEEISNVRYYNGTIWSSFSQVYIQDTEPEDKGGIWIDTSDEKKFTSSNGIIQNLLQVISVLQTKVSKLEWAFNSQMDFGNFTNNQYYEYDKTPAVEPSYGTNVTEDAETLAASIVNNVIDEVEPTNLSLIPNGTHLCVKSGTYAEMMINKNDFLPKELLFCWDTNQLFVKHPKTLKLVQIGASSTPTPEEDEIMEQILTEVIGTGGSSKTKITGIEFADMTNKDNTYLVSIKNGQWDIHDYRLDKNTLAGNAQVVGTGNYYSTPYYPIDAATVGSTLSPKIYVNMVYCGDESTSKSYNPVSHSFIELSNLGKADLNLKGLYIHYTERNSNLWVSLPLYGTIKSGGTFLIRGAQCSILNVNTTKIKVEKYDMEWTKASTLNNLQLEVAGDEGAGVPAHSIWGANNLIKLSTSCALYITGEDSTAPFSSNPLSEAAPWNSTGVIKWFVDLVGIGKYNTLNMPAENAPYATFGSNILLKRYHAMDTVKQATQALTERTNAKWWTHIKLDSINPLLDITDYTPKASSESKTVFYDKHLLSEGAPNIVTCSFGHNAHTTRCFNWVSVGYYDEYLTWTTTSGDYSNTANKAESFKSNDGRVATNNRNNTIYNRIRSITTDGTPFTVHKLIIDFPEPTAGTTQTYYYKVGRDSAWTDERSFTMRNRADVIASGYNYLQVTDQQGFNQEEYETWRLSAEFIDSKKATVEANGSTNNYDFCINTGDATQNGNRINEWIDYFKGGDTIFKNTEQMYTVGNNDLCSLDATTLGYGEDSDKINPVNVNYFFTFEHPYTVPVSSAGVYIPCVYSFVYGNTYFLCMNSEITDTTRVDVLGDIVGVNVYNDIKTWCDNDLLSHAADTDIKWKTAFCHESPFTVMVADLMLDFVNKDTWTTNPEVLRGGSHLNTVNSYWFSQFLQNNGFKLCLCGHKHTYCNSRYLREDPLKTMQPIIYDAGYTPATEVAPAIYPSWYDSLSDRGKKCLQFSNVSTDNYVRYVMCQATGYKLSSNKELPAPSIPWLMKYYPGLNYTENVADNSASVTVNTAQQFPTYIIWNVGNGTEVENPADTTIARDRIKGCAYKIQKSVTSTVWPYKYNTPLAYTGLKKVGANGVTLPDEYIIVAQTL